MKSKGMRTCLSICIGAVVLAIVFFAGAGVGYFVPQIFDSKAPVTGPIECPPCAQSVETPTDGENTIIPTECPECPYIDPSGDTPEEYEDLFAPFWETWDIVHEEFVDQPVDDLTLMRGAIEGMLDALDDRHTSYMSPEEFEQANESLEGEYEGIGAWVDITGDYVEIISPMKGSPAAEAGLQPNDQVIGVNGEDMTEIPGDLVLQRILGPAGTDITLTIQRGEEVFDVTITRANIVVPTVDYEMLEDDIAYVALYNYGDKSTEQLREALQELLAQDAIGLIFDLRDNGGGYLDTAIEVVSEFVGDGVVMYEQYGDGETYAYEAIPGGLATEIPLVVLVNGGTASASEITAGAIQDLDRGPLVGTTTYGKGSVQSWIALKDNAGGVRVTIARWLTPDGRQISEVGLEPEYIVEMTEEDYEAGRDPQLDKAVEVLKDLVQ
ncbi:MAG: S41 family peptidase [Chloroflexota bacterium]|jgi:carboxyl-terminal processing protease|nr:S41 family peptidase [Chloroflexota bacterium]